LKNLFKSPYNRQNIIFALRRFIYWKIIRLLKLKNIKYTIWDDRKILLNSNSFQYMWLMYNYIVDWEEFNLIRDYLNKDDEVADIGANVGYYSLWMSKFIGNNGMIHAFEPDERNFSILKDNIEMNKLLPIITLNKVALS